MVLSLTPPAELFAGGGESGALLAAIDWSDRPVGPPGTWPEALRVALGILLPSSAAICMFWGDDHVAFYNDAYAPAIGDNHPAALGRPAREGWAGVWSTLRPLLDEVRRTGQPFNRSAHPFRQNRFGFEEDTYFDVSYAPVRGPDGRVDGVFCIVADQTRRVLDERRLHTLRTLSMQAPLGTAEQAATAFMTVLAENDRSDAPYALVYLRGPEGGMVLRASHGGMPVATLRHVPPEPADNADPRILALARVLRTGTTERLDRARFLLDPPDAASEQVVVLPLRAGHDTAGVLAVAKNRWLLPNGDYRRFFELLAGQLSAALSAARVLSDERHRSRVLEQQVSAALAEREVAESRLRQAQKMEAIGKLTGGVAHDFNNLLQVVSGNLQLLTRDTVGNPRAEKRIANALAGVERGAKLSAQLLAFSRRQPLEPKVVRIGRLLSGLDDMLRRSLGEAIEIEISIGAGLGKILVDPAQMENALLNLAINARDAMEERGRLLIEAANVSVDEEYCREHTDLAPGHFVMVAVSDTGSGMTPEIMEHVFEPFFSTKPEGKGTGLGLSMVYGFVKQSGGHVRLTSEIGVGTTVRLYLPRTSQDEDELEAADAEPVRGGNETILVAEDNEGVRDTVVAMLVELGYRVLKAKDAAGALNVLESGVPIDLLFTDVVMPGPMRGPDLAHRARLRIPNLAVLFTSGYTEDAMVHGGRLDPGVELLSKPYTNEALARKIRQVLSTRGPERGGSSDPLFRSQRRDGREGGGVHRPLRLLLVEDDALIRDSSAELLAARGHEVAQASTAEIALDLLRRHGIDVLITDLGLPGLGGVALARVAAERQPGLGLIFATGKDDIGEPLTGTLAGAVLLRKPFDAEALLDAVTVASRNRR